MAISTVHVEEYGLTWVNNTYVGGEGFKDTAFCAKVREFFPDARHITVLRQLHKAVPYFGQVMSNNHWKIMGRQISKVLPPLGDNDLILLYDADEGVSTQLLQTFNELIPYLGDDTTEFAYITGAINSTRTISAINYEMPDNLKGMRVFLQNSWELSCGEYCEQNFVTRKDQPKQKDFLCFNRNFRDSRVVFLGLLKHYNLTSKGYISMGPNTNDTVAQRIESWRESLLNGFFREYWKTMWSKQTLDNVVRGWTIDPVERIRLHSEDDEEFWSKDESVDYSHAKTNMDQPLYEGVHYFVVTETAYPTTNPSADTVSADCHFLTEKTFRQIALRMPLILVSRPGILEAMRSRGYQTFHPHIDETYDTIENDDERMMAIITEMMRLSKFTDQQWDEWHKEVDKITEFNYNVLNSKTLEIIEITEELDERPMD